MENLNVRIIAAMALAFVCLNHPATAASLTKGNNMKVMCVGDSITLGKDTRTGGYRSVLSDWLTATGYPITYVGKEDDGDPANATVTSSLMTTPGGHEGYGSFRIDMTLHGGTAEKRTAPPITTTLAKYQPDIVLLMIGTNDIMQNWELDKINDRLEQLIATIFESDPKITLFVASIAPISPNRPGKEELVVAYNAAIPGIVTKYKALNHNIGFVDIHAALEKGGLSGDGVHPGKAGYQKIAAAWYQALTGETAPPPPVEKKVTPATPVSTNQPAAQARTSTYEERAMKTGATENKAPAWIKHGAYVYCICTPDDPDCLISTEAGLAITYHLLDGSIAQIPIINGVIGDDHLGGFNWDGIWPDWNRVSFRGKSWDNLHDFMQRVSDQSNTKVSFHVNLTDVNIGLTAYPETRAFFKKLVETKSIYRRDWNAATNKRDAEPPYVPQDFPGNETNPTAIFALVNYKNFWDSGLAKQMIDEFYSHLPYPPPVLYVDVLTLAGGNFATGYPDGPLGGSKETQLAGVLAIANYLKSKGTDLGTEGDRPFLKELGTYGWLHCATGVSAPDYSKIQGAAKGVRAVTQHVLGNTGCFVVAPIASSPGQIAKVRAHYIELLAGLPNTRKMPGLDTWHIADRGAANDEFNILPRGGSDPFRGDWVDLVNDFYLTGIQELYHIGKGNVCTAVYNTIGNLHFRKFVLTDQSGKETAIPVQDCLPPSFPEWGVRAVQQSGVAMLEGSFSFHFNAPQAGKYRLKFFGNPGGRATGDLNVYVNQQRQLNLLAIPFKNLPYGPQIIDLGEITLNAGANTLAVDSGPLYAKWSDGTEAVWETPSLGNGFKVTNGDVTFADDYDRMWPDTWSGEKKIYFFSWDGTRRTWKLPPDWAAVNKTTLYPLTPTGRGPGVTLAVSERAVAPKLLPQIPYVLIPKF